MEATTATLIAPIKAGAPMKQNKYDDAAFFEAYTAMPRSVDGLPAAGEWHAFRALLPDLCEKSVLDLGCGLGWHCRHARESGARNVLGVDLSERSQLRPAQRSMKRAATAV